MTLPVGEDPGRVAEVIAGAVLSLAERGPATEVEKAPSGP